MFNSGQDVSIFENKDDLVAKLACLYESEVQKRKKVQIELQNQSEIGREFDQERLDLQGTILMLRK